MTEPRDDATEQSPESLGDSLLRSVINLPQPKIKNPIGAGGLKAMQLPAVSLRGLAVVACLAALFGTTVVFILNAETRLLKEGSQSVLPAVAFIVVVICYRFCQRYLIAQSSRAVEDSLHHWRKRMMQKVSRLSLRHVEDMGKSELSEGLTRHYEPLSQSIITIASGVENFILLLFMYVYLIFLSPMAALLTGFVGLITVVAYLSVSDRMGRNMRESGAADSLFGDLSRSSVEGVKELRLNAKKRADFLSDGSEASEALYEKRAAGASLYAEVMASGTTASYLMAGSVVFLLPILDSSQKDDVSRIVMAVLFIIGPIGGVIASIQQFNIARFSVQALMALESKLDVALGTLAMSETAQSKDLDFADFDEIKLSHVGYTHRVSGSDDVGFSVADIDLHLKRGTIAFITGSNGSGKTTIMRVIVGLYNRSQGDIAVDGEVLDTALPQAYRDLFATVFTDYHLFTKPYALNDEQLGQLRYWLERLGIASKLSGDVSEGIDGSMLSTGQRKRLALALALAEGRPIIVLDEWAADQDPQTRQFFYTELLPELKAAGRSFIIVTHDEKYFSQADLHYHAEYGQLTLVDNNQTERGS